MKECSKCRNCYNDAVETCPLDDNFLVFTITGDTVISGRYILESRLGQGGMGIVFKAKHRFLKSSHAIKIILPSLVNDDKSLLVRFRQEAVLAASIDHPNVIRVTDFGVENDIMPFLVMEFVDGTPLSFYLQEGRPLMLSDAYGLFRPAALGVAEAHRKGIAHRDLKPQNIMVQKNLPPKKAVKVLDFGLAKIKSADSYPSLIQAQTLNIVGSPPYMSPEQWSGEGVDHRTDIYALAVIFFQMLTGRLPFQGDNMPAMMYQHLTVPAPTAASMGIPLSPDIEAVIQKGLQKEPDNRYDSLDTMLIELGQAIANSDTSDFTRADTEYIISPISSSARIPKPVDTAPLSNSQKERFYSYFDSLEKPVLLADGQLAQDFLDAQDRIEIAKTQAVRADLLVQELAEAQKQAEEAQEKAVQAKQRIEADVRRQVEAEMERLVVEGHAQREAEALRLAEEVDARKKAEDRANYLAQAALEAQQLAEIERKKREEESQQRELHLGVRRQAELAAQQLAEQVAEAKRKYEEAKNEAACEAGFRMEAEAKRQKIESELYTVAQNEAERRKLIEAEAKKQIQQQADRFEKEAFAAQQRLEEARLLTEFEAQKREQADAARVHAEEEAKRLEQEIIEVQRQMQEMRQHITAESRGQYSSLQNFDSPKSLSPDRFPSGRSPSYGSNPGSPLQDTIAGLTQATHGQSGQPSKEIPFNLLNTGRVTVSKTPVVPIAVGILAILLLAGGGLGIYFMALRPGNVVDERGDVNRSVENPAATTTFFLPERVLIQGGRFQMGRNDIANKMDEEWGNQYPAHAVPVNPFYIDRTETTNEQYAQFVTATDYKPPSYWTNGKPPAGEEKFPVTSVTLADAKAYADWISKRDNKKCSLPTEEQWEFAARNGSKETLFPWGDVWRPDSSKLDGRAVAVGTSNDKTEVGGIEDMLGNVSEWTTSTYSLYPGHTGVITPDQHLISVRGLNWSTPAASLKKPNWLLTFRNPVPEDEKYAFLGFRLVCEP